MRIEPPSIADAIFLLIIAVAIVGSLFYVSSQP